uniref:K Homology domain-containing protein n=1 Tax=Aegilops tauschii subsp. strangulata TaxID=200361 RepID=A0A453MYE0_AEGTS
RRQDAMWERRTHARILVSDADAGCIIGKAGYDIHAMEARSGAHIKLSGRGRPLPGTDRRVVLVSGLFRTVMDAAELVLEKLFYLVKS